MKKIFLLFLFVLLVLPQIAEAYPAGQFMTEWTIAAKKNAQNALSGKGPAIAFGIAFGITLCLVIIANWKEIKKFFLGK